MVGTSGTVPRTQVMEEQTKPDSVDADTCCLPAQIQTPPPIHPPTCIPNTCTHLGPSTLFISLSSRPSNWGSPGRTCSGRGLSKLWRRRYLQRRDTICVYVCVCGGGVFVPSCGVGRVGALHASLSVLLKQLCSQCHTSQGSNFASQQPPASAHVNVLCCCHPHAPLVSLCTTSLSSSSSLHVFPAGSLSIELQLYLGVI